MQMNQTERRDLEAILAEVGEDFHGGKLNCAESVLCAMTRYYGWDLKVVPRIATPFGGGFGGMQLTCGAFSGALMALGLLLGREAGGDKAPSYEAAKKLYKHMAGVHGAPDCSGLIGIDLSDPNAQAAFRAPGGKHETVCEKLVPALCRYLASEYPR